MNHGKGNLLLHTVVALFDAYWGKGKDVSQSDIVQSALVPSVLSAAELAKAIELCQTDEIKQALTKTTTEAVERGAFGGYFLLFLKNVFKCFFFLLIISPYNLCLVQGRHRADHVFWLGSTPCDRPAAWCCHACPSLSPRLCCFCCLFYQEVRCGFHIWRHPCLSFSLSLS